MPGALSTRAEFAACYPLRVRWGEVDAQRVVFNAHYLAYADVALTEYMRSIELPYEVQLAQGFDTMAVRAELDFAGSAVFDDELELAARVEQLGRTSFRVLTGIFRGQELLTQLRITYVTISLHERKPIPMDEGFIRKVLAFERTAPLRK